MTQITDLKVWGSAFHDLGKDVAGVLEGITGNSVHCFELRPRVQPSHQVDA